VYVKTEIKGITILKFMLRQKLKVFYNPQVYVKTEIKVFYNPQVYDKTEIGGILQSSSLC